MPSATATSDGIEVVERLLRAVTAEGHSFGCTASIGVALSTPDTKRFEMLIERADRAMYRAKLAGKNRIAPAEDADSAHAADLRPRAPVIVG